MGATEFLYAAGFRPETIENNGIEEQVFIWSLDNIENLDTLQVKTFLTLLMLIPTSVGITMYILNLIFQFLRDVLKAEERVELEIDRNLQVLSPAQAAQRIELPPDFYALTPEELKKEKQMR